MVAISFAFIRFVEWTLWYTCCSSVHVHVLFSILQSWVFLVYLWK